MKITTVALGTDHAGFELKQHLKAHLESVALAIVDCGTHSSESCDYPDFVIPAARCVAEGRADAAIVLGGSGNGEAIAANKVRGIRCALCWSVETARLARQHNDANVIALGARFLAPDEAVAIVEAWLETRFEGGRHLRRIGKIAAFEQVS